MPRFETSPLRVFDTEPGVPRKDPLVVLTRSEYPKVSEFDPELLSAVRAILPDYEGPMLPYTPHPFTPETFADIKAREPQMHTGEFNIIRSNAIENLGNDRKARFKTAGVNVNALIADIVFPTDDVLYTLRFDEFPSNVPGDTQHFNLWLRDDSLSPDALSLVVVDSLRTLGVTPAETVIIEKKRQARLHAGTITIPGQTPSVADIRHPHLYVVKKPIQPVYAPLKPF